MIIFHGEMRSSRTLEEGYIRVRAFSAVNDTIIGHVALFPNIDPPSIRVQTLIPQSVCDFPIDPNVGMEMLLSKRKTAEFLADTVLETGDPTFLPRDD